MNSERRNCQKYTWDERRAELNMEIYVMLEELRPLACTSRAVVVVTRRLRNGSMDLPAISGSRSSRVQPENETYEIESNNKTGLSVVHLNHPSFFFRAKISLFNSQITKSLSSLWPISLIR